MDEIGTARGYPRPLLQRPDWLNLNGQWDFALDPDANWTSPAEVRFDRRIHVPFAPETPASGVEYTGFLKACWYRRQFARPKLPSGQRLILHFGAVDYQASVWVNGRLAVEHEGGYTPFSADITDLLSQEGPQTVIVRAQDDPQDMHKPRGKQDWLLRPHSIWYMRTSGIWQTVWMECVPAVRIEELVWSADVPAWQIMLGVRTNVAAPAAWSLRVRLTHEQRSLAEDTWRLDGPAVRRVMGLADPGIEDARHALLWTPEHPAMIDAQIELVDAQGRTVDRVHSYTAMRQVACGDGRFMLNGRPYYLRLVLDQGYWPEGGLTAPDDGALRRDVELLKSMGFNGVRMHQKIEDPRFLYWADRLGLLVWEEMPSAYAFDERTVARVTSQWTEAVLRDRSHPCIVVWVPFNESWGVPDLPTHSGQRALVEAAYHLTKALDPARPVVGNDGWENPSTDIIAIHDYDAQPQRLAQRYAAAPEQVGPMLQGIRPAGRAMMLSGTTWQDKPIMLTEFGGIALSRHRGDWGYSRAATPADLAALYGQLLATVRSVRLLAGFCYTQFTDTYQEANGLLTMDRRPKFAVEDIACATRGPLSAKQRAQEARWIARCAALGGQSPRRQRAKRAVRKQR